MNIFNKVGYVDEITHGSTGTHVTYAWKNGITHCTCVSFQIRKKCKHMDKLVNEMVYSIDDILKDEAGKKTNSFLSVLNDLFEDKSYNSNEVFALYGKPKVGKSLFCIQEACKLSSEGKNVLFVDTEGSIIPMLKKWVPVFEERYGKRKGKILVESRKSIENLMKFLGHIVILQYKSKDKKMSKGKLEFSVIESIEGEIDSIIKKNKIDFVILDSLTSPLRSFTKEQQNYPARSDATAFIMRSFVKLQEEYEVGCLMTIHACHDENTMTLTKENGIVNYKDVDIGNHVLGLDENNKTVWTRVNDKYVSDYDGLMIHLKGKSTDQLVTPNHRVLVERSYGRPSRNDLLDNKYMYAENIVDSGVNVIRSSNEIITDELIKKSINNNPLEYLVGFYVAEGDSHIDKKYPRTKRVRFSIHTKEIEHVLDKMKMCGYIPSITTRGNSSYLTLCGDYGRDFYQHIKDIHNWSNKKSIPETILENGNKEKQLSFLMGYLFGDGHKATDTMWYYTTTSKKIVDDLAILCSKLGLSFNFKSKNNTYKNLPRCKKENGIAYQGTIRLTNKSFATPTKQWYKGKIWCLTTGTGNFAIVRNGKLTFSGNSFNPANVYETMAEATGGIVLHHYAKRLIYLDKRDAKAYRDFRRFWLVRGENAPEWSKAAVAKIDATGYNNVTNKEDISDIFTINEKTKLGI
jgi:RecA/RadA recombinase